MRILKALIIILIFKIGILTAGVQVDQISKIFNPAEKSATSGNGHVYLFTDEMKEISSSMMRKLNINAPVNYQGSRSTISNSEITKKAQVNSSSNSIAISFSEMSSLVQNNQL